MSQHHSAAGDADQPLPWEILPEPVWWRAADMWVIADRHLPDGTRQHVVRGSVPAGTVIANAQVFGEECLEDRAHLVQRGL